MTLDCIRILGGWACLVSLAALGACVDRGTSDDGSDDSADASGGMDDDGGRPGSADDDSGHDTSDSPGDPSAGDPPPGELPGACAEACEAYVQCHPDELTLEECVQDCTLALEVESPECEAALLDLIDCFAGLDCEDWFTEGACSEQEDALEDQCDGGDGVCEVGVGGGEDGTCGAVYWCTGEPSYSIECDTTECRCYEDDHDVGGCPSDGICEDGAAGILDHAETCCGWF